MNIKVNPVTAKNRRETPRSKSAGLIKSNLDELADRHEAVENLNQEEHDYLNNQASIVWEELTGKPALYPHFRLTKLHFQNYSRFVDPLVLRLLDEYGETNIAFGFDLYSDDHQLESVWNYRQSLVDAIS